MKKSILASIFAASLSFSALSALAAEADMVNCHIPEHEGKSAEVKSMTEQECHEHGGMTQAEMEAMKEVK